MPYQQLSIENIRELIHKGEVKDPLVFLESIMNGYDLRRLSSIYELVMEIDAFTGGDIGPGEWAEIVDHVSSRYKFQTVSLSESTNAAKTIAEYLHAKRKQVDVNGAGQGNNLNNSPLTEEEIELFKEKFNDDF